MQRLHCKIHQNFVPILLDVKPTADISGISIDYYIPAYTSTPGCQHFYDIYQEFQKVPTPISTPTRCRS